MANANDKPFLGVPGGDVRIETPDGVTRTFGDSVRNNLTDADYVYNGHAHGAFPRESDDLYGGEPTMRKPINE